MNESAEPAGVVAEGETPVVNFNFIVEALVDGSIVCWAAMDCVLDANRNNVLLTEAYRSDDRGDSVEPWAKRRIISKVLIHSNFILATKV